MSILHPQDVGIILSYYCNSACKHCLYNCGPRWEQEPMAPEMLAKALDAIMLWERPPQVHFTGGEPFLHFDLLLSGVRGAVDRGITCYVETSASWCLDDEQVQQRFDALKQSGMQAILISCSPFHAEKIPPVRTLRAVRASLEIFGSQGTIVYLPEYLKVVQQFELERPTPLARYEEILGEEEAGRILWQGYGIISGGRSGYRLGHLVTKYLAEVFEGATCKQEILYAHHSHFDLYGNYISGFCGGLSIGSWHDLPQILDDRGGSSYPSLINALIECGPFGLAEMAQEEYGYELSSDGYTGKCHLCVDVRRHLVGVGDFPELRPLGFYERI